MGSPPPPLPEILNLYLISQFYEILYESSLCECWLKMKSKLNKFAIGGPSLPHTEILISLFIIQFRWLKVAWNIFISILKKSCLINHYMNVSWKLRQNFKILQIGASHPTPKIKKNIHLLSDFDWILYWSSLVEN